MPGIVQSATTHIIEIAVTGTGTLAVDHQTSGVEQNGGTVTPVSQHATATGAGTTTTSSAPGASTQRTVQSMSAVNRGTQPVTAQYKKDVSGTEFMLTPPIPLDPNWSVQYTADSGFQVFDAVGRVLGCCMAGYALLKAPTLLTSSGTYTPSIGCAAILIELWGGGGAGASADFNVAPNIGFGGGGAAGGQVRKFVIGVPASISYTIGAAGAAAAAGNNAGGAGGATSMTINGVTYGAAGGSGGAAPGAGGSTIVDSAGGAGVSNVGGQAGDENLISESGQAGMRLSGTQGRAGEGGSSTIGSGGSGRCTNGAGNAATGLASGGGGGAAVTGDVQGGAGTGGAIRVWEFAAG